MVSRQLIRAITVAVVVAIIGFVLYYLGAAKSGGLTGSRPYQAVFLSNGQVYFGKITKRTTASTTVTDIYYLQVQQPIQPPDPKQQQQVQIQLVKLGNELHKPKDEMVINNEHILFIEEIQDDGQVGQAIARHKRGEKDQGTAQPSTSSGQGQ